MKKIVFALVFIVAGLVIIALFSATESPSPSPDTVQVGTSSTPENTGKYTIETLPLDNEAPPPAYTGRDPSEVRPVAEEVKLFNEEQKTALYGIIQSLGANLKENPDDLEGWLILGIRKKTIGDFEGARDAWEYASVIRPLNSVSFENLGDLYWRYLKDFPKAEANFKMTIKNDPKKISAYVSLAELYFYSYKEKQHLFDDTILEGLKTNPGDVNLMKALAYLYERGEEYSKALEWWQKALDLEPDNADVKARIEKLKQKI